MTVQALTIDAFGKNCVCELSESPRQSVVYWARCAAAVAFSHIVRPYFRSSRFWTLFLT